MIRLVKLNKSSIIRGKRRLVADDITAVFPRKRRIGLLGRAGPKKIFLKMLAGAVPQDSGIIDKKGNISFPIGYSGSFHKELTGVQNVRFVARIYGVDCNELIDYVKKFTELGRFINRPVASYNSDMLSKLAFGVSMGIPFSYYLINEMTSVGDKHFKKKCRPIMEDRLKRNGAIIVSNKSAKLRRYCSSGAILKKGRLILFDDINDAINTYSQNK
jgi:capsular polysaccharide transport system ATP-binding protein